MTNACSSQLHVTVDVDVGVGVDRPVFLAALVNRNDIVEVIGLPERPLTMVRCVASMLVGTDTRGWLLTPPDHDQVCVHAHERGQDHGHVHVHAVVPRLKLTRAN